MSNVIEIKENNLDIISSPELFNKLIIIDFWASWCGPCRQLTPVIGEIAAQFSEQVIVLKVNVDENNNLSTDSHIRSIPTLLFYKGGIEVGRSIGFNGKDATVQLVEKYLA